MKKIAKPLSLILAAFMIFQCGITASAAEKIKSKYNGKTYTHQTRFDEYDISYGIDVSQHNGDINFKKVKADGIDYVFIRVGYTGYTKSAFSLNYDKKYKTYIKDAIAAGLDVGVYWYSQALTVNEAVQEANKLLTAISSYDITMPVVFDYEFACTSAGRLDSAKLSKARMTENALAFLDTVSSAGYDGCLYASENFLKEKLYADKISSLYPIWLANYSTSTNYSGDFEYWQHTSAGKVSGIGGNVDINFRYVGDIYELENQVYTGMPITPEPVVYFDGYLAEKGVDYELVYHDNVNVGIGVAEAVGLGVFNTFKTQYRFRIAPAKVENLTYVSNSDTSLTYCWSAVNGATSYKLYITNNTNANTFTKTVTETFATISGLTPGNEYSVKVCAGGLNSKGVTLWGDYSDVDTKITSGSKVTGLKVKSRSSSAVRISWKKVAGCQQYVIYKYNSTTGKYQELARVSGSKDNYKADGLTAGKAYKFKVSAVINGQEGTRSDGIKATVRPKKVSLKSAKNTSKRKISVKWSKTTADGYQIQWSTKKSFSSDYKSVIVSKGSQTSKTIKTSKSKRTYYVRIRAYKNENGTRIYGSWSSVKAVKVR